MVQRDGAATNNRGDADPDRAAGEPDSGDGGRAREVEDRDSASFGAADGTFDRN